jgi:T5orf172 domain
MASVYIYTNKAMPGLVKIGWTSRNAKVRVREQHEGLPYPHDVAHEFYFEEDKNARFAVQNFSF